MITDKEYILLSVLSYCNFGETEYKKTLWDIFLGPHAKDIIISTFDILNIENRKLFLEYFENELKRWRVFKVDNRTVTAQDSYKVSGYYAVVFENSEKYIISYRGSEKYPIEDAYKDFIETDLAIGFGKIPKQFYEGIEIYNLLITKYNISKNDIILTGHSLGGGIAQYVALTIDKNKNYIPKVYTWNGVGINRDGIVNILEFLDLKTILKKNTDLTDEELKNFNSFESSYLNFFLKELKNMKVIKDNTTYLLEEHQKIKINIDADFIKRLLKNTNIENCLMKFDYKRRKNLVIEQKLLFELFQIKNLNKILLRAKYLINKVKSNRAYEKNIKNYGHSKDLTNSLFKHLGSSYLLDKNFTKRKKSESSLFLNFKLFTKSIQDLHFEDVFFAHINSKTCNFDLELNENFIASAIRYIIKNEYFTTKRLLVAYYTMENIDENNFLELRNELLKSIEKNDDYILYKDKIISKIREIEIKEFIIIWEKTKKKLASPYKKQDFFDIFIFKT